MLTIEEVKAAMPAGTRSNIDQAYVDKINAVLADPDTSEQFRDNFLTFSYVITEGKYTLQDYLSAVRYTSFKQMGLKNKEAYEKTFPDRMLKFAAMGKSDKDISAHMSAYHKGKLVQSIMEKSAIEPWLLYQDAFAVGVRTLVDVCRKSTNDVARASAGNALLTHLKRPEAAKIKLDITTTDTSLDKLADMMGQFAAAQQQAIASGSASAKQIAHMPMVIEHEPAKQ